VRVVTSALVSIVVLLAGCAGDAAPAASTSPAASSPFLLKASIKELMDAQVDPAADVIWESVYTRISEAGREDHQPRTPEDWQAIRRSALTLIESTNLLVMEGRRIAPPDAPREPGEPSTTVLQQRLDTNHAAFVGFAQALRQVALKTLDAVDAKDPQRVFDVGGEIDEACEACHVVFWYPPEATPR
jgi:cytochrome c556